MAVNTPSSPSLREPPLNELQATLEREIPMCRMMGIEVLESGQEGLVVRIPLEQNRNHKQTAFAGSLNALCTIAGWGTTYLLLKELESAGDIVIRRSTIRYQLPVDSEEVVARCHPVTPAVREYFVEMLDEKGQGKLDLTVEIEVDKGTAVVFNGSYVVARRK